ncbi:IclR family transcriptional regulator C-terminal domain-containing protein [Hydrogenophaga sp. SNF1]|uniref:IclR family transcriptional regulator domain-containing protein n=1 Tax=Hydrogenophaga sp. SNF1 TaxID=3098762 RepID=UPI002ACC2D07|nr:IclR family transcriptional regulator C-terminal domain-containing protein [Hydrogenophaga sp. SNF1]WQB84714.1 IclR family transcriptional regulator C-terminal domain-containing protein [Hydrogenophaga sp. SNF1]
MTAEQRSHPRDFVASLEKGLKVLLCFERKHPRLNLSEVARLTGYTPAATRRLLLTLQELDYLRSDGKWFWVAPRTLLLARPYLLSRPAPQLAQPVLDTLADRTRQSASLGVLLDQEMLVIARSTGRRTLSAGLGIGSRLPIFCSSLGRAVLSMMPAHEVASRLGAADWHAYTPNTVQNLAAAMAQVDHCRTNGWAECNEELELGVRSIAVPISRPADATCAAISLSVRAERMSMDTFRITHLNALLEARDELQSTVRFD